MSKLNRGRTSTPRTSATSPIKTTVDGLRDEKSELFLSAVSGFYGESKFYELADAHSRRFVDLVRKVTVIDPDWVAGYIGWLRGEANIRTAAIVGAAEYANVVRKRGHRDSLPSLTVRQVVASVLQRADEPGEFVAYWREKVQRSVPGGVQRGVADAVVRLFSEYAYLKWDSQKASYRFADVLNLTHPGTNQPMLPWQRDLFQYTIDRAFGNVDASPEHIPVSLSMIIENTILRAETDPTAWLNAERLKRAGMTWEDVLSAVGGKIDKGKVWTAIIPSMGYMALLRNLRNFDEEGVGDDMAHLVGELLADPAQVAKSRQLPFRFLSAYRATKSLRWGPYLERALYASLDNIPRLPGRTLILVDTSGSMHSSFSKDGTLLRWDAAAIFGIAVAQRAEAAEVVSFSNATKVFPIERGESLLRALDRWKNGGYFFGGGTATGPAVTRHYKDHDRVIVLTDEQANIGGRYGVFSAVPAHRPTYTWNLAGYSSGHNMSGERNRHTFGGLTDQAFKLIPLLEAGKNTAWPWELATD